MSALNVSRSGYSFSLKPITLQGAVIRYLKTTEFTLKPANTLNNLYLLLMIFQNKLIFIKNTLNNNGFGPSSLIPKKICYHIT